MVEMVAAGTKMLPDKSAKVPLLGGARGRWYLQALAEGPPSAGRVLVLAPKASYLCYYY
jgi:hypothetical protein